MNNDEIIEMATEAGLASNYDDYPDIWDTFMNVGREEIVAFAHLVAAKATEEANARANASWTLMCEKMVAIEREACAKVADNRLLLEASKKERDAYNLACKNIAAEIKSRIRTHELD